MTYRFDSVLLKQNNFPVENEKKAKPDKTAKDVHTL